MGQLQKPAGVGRPGAAEGSGWSVVTCLQVNAHRAAWPRTRFGVLLQQLLAQCHAEVLPQQHYEWCVYDACGGEGQAWGQGGGMCGGGEGLWGLTEASHSCDSGGDCECICSAIATYAAECSRHGLHLRWRSQGLCRECPLPSIFDAPSHHAQLNMPSVPPCRTCTLQTALGRAQQEFPLCLP